MNSLRNAELLAKEQSLPILTSLDGASPGSAQTHDLLIIRPELYH
jgi:hypothetical protein